MAIFGVVTNLEPVVTSFVKDTNKRLADSNLVRNPFTGAIKTFVFTESQNESPANRRLFIVSISPIYFNFTVFGWLMAFCILAIWGVTFWVLPGIILGCLGIFWRREFYYLMFKFGVRKAGYTGPIKLVKSDEVLNIIYFKEV